MAFNFYGFEGDMSWLTKGTCSGTSAFNPFTISNISITTGTADCAPVEPIPAGDLVFSDVCAHADDDDCGSACPHNKCKWSWPADDPA